MLENLAFAAMLMGVTTIACVIVAFTIVGVSIFRSYRR